jgi:hypothetical protein
VKTPKQYADLLCSVDDRGFYTLDIRAEDVEDLVAAAQAEALEEAARSIERHLATHILVVLNTHLPAYNLPSTSMSRLLQVVRGLDVTKQSDS